MTAFHMTNTLEFIFTESVRYFLHLSNPHLNTDSSFLINTDQSCRKE